MAGLGFVGLWGWENVGSGSHQPWEGCMGSAEAGSSADGEGAADGEAPNAGGPSSSAAAPTAKRKGKGKAKAEPKPKKVKKEPWTKATLEMVRALQTVCPPEQMAKPKAMFKMGTHAPRPAAHCPLCAHAR